MKLDIAVGVDEDKLADKAADDAVVAALYQDTAWRAFYEVIYYVGYRVGLNAGYQPLSHVVTGTLLSADGATQQEVPLGIATLARIESYVSSLPLSVVLTRIGGRMSESVSFPMSGMLGVRSSSTTPSRPATTMGSTGLQLRASADHGPSDDAIGLLGSIENCGAGRRVITIDEVRLSRVPYPAAPNCGGRRRRGGGGTQGTEHQELPGEVNRSSRRRKAWRISRASQKTFVKVLLIGGHWILGDAAKHARLGLLQVADLYHTKKGVSSFLVRSYNGASPIGRAGD